ncbi:MAG: hypothetical protein FWH16_03605 [Oscillospiraceae bacterium]|nr:hypothetical protein [Oscillospiraceae bacterium]
MKHRKMLALILALAISLALAACGDNTAPAAGSPNTPPPPETLPDTSTPSPDPTPDDNDPGSGGDPVVNYGTIPMPDGFPENPGDAEFFSPVTDDYLILHDPEAASWYGEKIYHLVSYDTSGEPVQWVVKVVWPSADVVPVGEFDFVEGWTTPVAGDGIVVGNAGFLDSMARAIDMGWEIPRALRSNYLPPTKDSADFTTTEYTSQYGTSEYRRNEGGYIIITESGYVIGPAPEHFYFSKP